VSDNCGGQNKNRFTFSMLQLAAAKFDLKITQKFLERGHTQTPGDSMHATIERAANLMEIFTDEEWKKVIVDCKQEGEKYSVMSMTKEKVYDFKLLVSQQNWDVDDAGVKVKWTKVRQIQFDGENPAVIKFRYDYSSPYQSLTTSNRRGRPINFKTYKPVQAYQTKLPLAAQKVKNIRSLCEKFFIPSKYHSYFETLLSDVEPTDGECEEVGENPGEDDPDSLSEFDGVLEELSDNERNDNKNDEENKSDNDEVDCVEEEKHENDEDYDSDWLC
jgi:hypothetical protein